MVICWKARDVKIRLGLVGRMETETKSGPYICPTLASIRVYYYQSLLRKSALVLKLPPLSRWRLSIFFFYLVVYFVQFKHGSLLTRRRCS
jgi:hypothetical protein